MSRTTRLLVALLLVCSLAAAAQTSAARPASGASATANGETLNRTFVLSLTPETPGEVRVRLAFEIPDDVTTLSTTLPDDASVTATEGFQHRGGSEYDWTRTTDSPSITYELPANRSLTRGRAGAETTGHLYVDAGEWAIVPAPRAGISYSGTGARPEVVTDYAFTGSGTTGGDIAYLGDYTVHERAAAGQRIRLVVPAAADLREEPAALLDALAGAAETVSFGPADPEVTAIAAPTTSVDWASTGLQRGAADFWVLDDRRLDTANSVWIHEYAHTRQSYTATNATRWSVEGMADYYAALVAYRQGHVDYERFRNHLEIGRGHDGVVLSEPETWEGTLANYDRGALVFAALDRRVRLETGGDATIQDVVRRFDDGDPLSQAEFLDAVAATAGSEARADARRYTETESAPETWTHREHAAAFGGGRATFDYSFAPPHERSGPYRTDRVEASPSVVVGETLAVRVAVENAGEATGDYRAALRAGGEPAGTRRGTLDPGARETLTYERTFSEAGEVTLAVGEATETVTVRRPAALRVTDLDAPERAAPGEPVELRATVASAADRPARGTVALGGGGRTLAREEFALAAGETATLTATTTFEAGDRAVTAGDRERIVRVREGATAARTDGDATAANASSTRDGGEESTVDGGATPTVGQPGFGAAAALAALAALAGLVALGTFGVGGGRRD